MEGVVGDEHTRIDRQRLGEGVDGLERHVTLADLGTADVGPIEARQLGQPLLRQFALAPQRAQTIAELRG